MSDILSSLRDAHRKAESFRKQKNTKHYPDEFRRMVLDAYSKGITVHKMRTVVDLDYGDTHRIYLAVRH